MTPASTAETSEIQNTAAPKASAKTTDAAVDAAIVRQLSEELSLGLRNIQAVLGLLAEGATVPFIARYRKEATGSLDEVQIRAIQERATYLRELEDRKTAVLKSIAEQGKLDDALAKKIAACTTKSALEDLYLPYKPKRRTRGAKAIEAGLLPLAELILSQPKDGQKPEDLAAAYVQADISEEDKKDKTKLVVSDIATALKGARDIIAEKAAETPAVRAHVRDVMQKQGVLKAEVNAEYKDKPTKFEQYYDFGETLSTIPSHRYLAIRRGEREGVLRFHVDTDAEQSVPFIQKQMDYDAASPMAEQLKLACEDAYKRLLVPSLETDTRIEMKMKADRSAVDIFADNLKNLLLAAPLGGKTVLAIDPGLRTGCKIAAIDATGKFMETTTINLVRGDSAVQNAEAELLRLVQKYEPEAIAVGNGTAGRETESFVRETIAKIPAEFMKDKKIHVVSVNESGASIYSASDVAREEFPDLDLTIRGAISIGRRLQDPLAELVKIDPKSIGVGQYQHDVHQPLLSKKLDEVVESCVNGVGVNLNTASAALLAKVSGISKTVAKNIVKHRDQVGHFSSRRALLSVQGMGNRTFEQAAGFLRIPKGEHPLDASAVHPERYEVVERMAKDLGVELQALIGNKNLVSKIDIQRYVGEDLGEPTLRDILDELQRPGRDPRKTFEPPKFKDNVRTLDDLKEDMRLDGIVTNVTAFGAFVDIGVHQDGLVHISELADHFVKDPKEVVKAGDTIKVRVLEVDKERKRISLSAKSSSEGSAAKGAHTQGKAGDRGDGGRGPRSGGRPAGGPKGGASRGGNRGRPEKKFSNNPFANAFK